MKKQLKTIYSKDREDWRYWLQRNHFSEKGVWLVYYKKHTKKLSITYNDAVEEAICFGWIDGQIKKIDDERYMQRYTPRRLKSRWSVNNIERAKRMVMQGRMTKEGHRIFQNGLENKEKVPSSKNFTVPVDFKSALANDENAFINFKNFAPSAKLAYVYWINITKRDETRQKRIRKAVKRIAQNKKYGEK